MFCNKCGQQLPDDAKFCASCGASFVGTQNSGVVKSGNSNKKLIIILASIFGALFVIIVALILVLVLDVPKNFDGNQVDEENTTSVPETVNGQTVYGGTIYVGDSYSVCYCVGRTPHYNAAQKDDEEYCAVIKLDSPIDVQAVNRNGQGYTAVHASVLLLKYASDYHRLNE